VQGIRGESSSLLLWGGRERVARRRPRSCIGRRPSASPEGRFTPAYTTQCGSVRVGARQCSSSSVAGVSTEARTCSQTSRNRRGWRPATAWTRFAASGSVPVGSIASARSGAPGRSTKSGDGSGEHDEGDRLKQVRLTRCRFVHSRGQLQPSRTDPVALYGGRARRLRSMRRGSQACIRGHGSSR
jgi:hypothetical protein